MTRNMIAGNWKMFKSPAESKEFIEEFKALIHGISHEFPVCLFPNFLSIATIQQAISDVPNVFVGAQNNHEAKEGAYTGETSAAMIKATGSSYVLIGHSERREYFNETGPQLLAKTKAAIENDLIPVFCCGEKLDDRKSGGQNKIIEQQLEEIIGKLSTAELQKTVIAYEPVWAIGTGETASPEQAQEMHQFIRQYLSDRFATAAQTTSILYGGSVKPANAADLFSQKDIDGGLIGGASLKPADFVSIIETMISLPNS